MATGRQHITGAAHSIQHYHQRRGEATAHRHQTNCRGGSILSRGDFPGRAGGGWLMLPARREPLRQRGWLMLPAPHQVAAVTQATNTGEVWHHQAPTATAAFSLPRASCVILGGAFFLKGRGSVNPNPLKETINFEIGWKEKVPFSIVKLYISGNF